MNAALPPLPFPGGSFDLVYAISVFTHLDEARQLLWLDELRRVTRPRAILILSVHGEHLAPAPSAAPGDGAAAPRIRYVTGPTGKWKTDGLPDFYQNSFHTRDYIRRTWSRHFDVLEYRDRAINNHQDAVVLRRR